MKTLWLVAFIVLITGCAAIKEQTANVKACVADPVCMEQAVSQAKKTREVGRAVGDALPFPAAPLVAGSVFYSVALLVGLMRGGKKIREQQQPV